MLNKRQTSEFLKEREEPEINEELRDHIVPVR